jgi:hypothetical protein
MTDYRATPEQWALLEEQSAPEYDSTILELRAKVKALEANTKQWRTDHLRLANTCASLAPDRSKFFNALLPNEEAEICDYYAALSAQHQGQAVFHDNSKPTPNPSQIRSSLVTRVARAIGRDDEPINWEPEARAAIREVLAWLQEGEHTWAALKLQQETER